MDGSSVVWENKERIYGEKLKKISFTLLIKSSLLIGNICSQICGEKPLKRIGKLAQKYSPNLVENNAQTPKFIESGKLAVGVLSDLSVDHPVDRQRSRIRPLEPPVDPKEQRALLSVPVDSVGRPAICQVKACTSCTSVDPSRSTDFRVSRLAR